LRRFSASLVRIVGREGTLQSCDVAHVSIKSYENLFNNMAAAKYGYIQSSKGGKFYNC